MPLTSYLSQIVAFRWVFLCFCLSFISSPFFQIYILFVFKYIFHSVQGHILIFARMYPTYRKDIYHFSQRYIPFLQGYIPHFLQVHTFRR